MSGFATAPALATVRSGAGRRLLASASIADSRFASNDAGQSSVEAKRCSKPTGPSASAAKRCSKTTRPSASAAKRSSSDAADAELGHVKAERSVSRPIGSGGASKRICGPNFASRTRSLRCPAPSGARSRKMSGWMVPKTDMAGPGDPASAGPVCVPADLSTNPRHIAAIPTGTARTPHRTKRSPTPTHVARRNGQRQRASPAASGSKHGDCGKNRSERWFRCRRFLGLPPQQFAPEWPKGNTSAGIASL